MDISDLTRLIDIDAALASDGGLHYATAAAKHGITTKTVQRLVALIRATGREIVLRESAETGKMSRHHYAAGVMRLFCSDDDRPRTAGGRQRVLDHHEIVRLAGDGLTTPQIAKKMGCSLATVGQVRREAGLAAPKGVRRSQYDIEKMKSLAIAGLSGPRIAKEIGCNQATVYQYCDDIIRARRLAEKNRPSPPRMPRRKRRLVRQAASVPESQVAIALESPVPRAAALLKAKIELGMTQAKAASMIGVHYGNVSKWLSGGQMRWDIANRIIKMWG